MDILKKFKNSLEKKMKVLAIETSSVVCSCSICTEEKILAKCSISTGLFHSKTLMGMVDFIFSLSNVELKNLKAVAVSLGPGSFTGLRIGLAVAKGICFGLNIPCVGVSTLKALSYNLLGFKGLVCPCMDAKNQRVYTSFFNSFENEQKRLIKDSVLEIKSLKKQLQQKKEKIFLVGDAATICYEQLKDLGNVFLAPVNLTMPCSTSVGLLAIKKLKVKTQFKEPNPKYLKLSQAEEELKKENNP